MKFSLLCRASFAMLLATVFQTVGATVITSGCSLDSGQACTLAELVNDNKYIEIDGVKFNNFDQFFFSGTDLNRIKVSAIDGLGDGNQVGSAVGLEFTTFDGLDSLLEEFSAGNYWVERAIFYDIEVNSGLAIGASNLQVKFGKYRYIGGVFLDGGVSKTIDRSGLGSVEMSALCSQYSNDINYGYTCEGRTSVDNEAFGPVYAMSVTDDLYIKHKEFTSGEDGMQILSFSQNYVRTVPEPGTLLLIGFSLAGLAFSRRRKAGF